MKAQKQKELIEKGLNALRVLSKITKTLNLTYGNKVADDMIQEFESELLALNDTPESAEISSIYTNHHPTYTGTIDFRLLEKAIKDNCNIEYSKTSGDEVVNSSLSAVCIAFEEYFKYAKSHQIEMRKELIIKILKKRVKNLITDDLISPFFWEDFANEILQSRPESKTITDEMIEKWARNKAQETGYDVTGIRAKMISIGAKALRDGLIKPNNK